MYAKVTSRSVAGEGRCGLANGLAVPKAIGALVSALRLVALSVRPIAAIKAIQNY